MAIKTYSELIKYSTLEERFEYLRLDGTVGQETFGFDRYLNQIFYSSREWKSLRDQIIIRDNGCDLGLDGYTIGGIIIIHHMNPITKKDILQCTDAIMNPEFLIAVSHRTHQAIHYGDRNLLPKSPIIRTKNDTCLWKH